MSTPPYTPNVFEASWQGAAYQKILGNFCPEYSFFNNNNKRFLGAIAEDILDLLCSRCYYQDIKFVKFVKWILVTLWDPNSREPFQLICSIRRNENGVLYQAESLFEDYVLKRNAKINEQKVFKLIENRQEVNFWWYIYTKRTVHDNFIIRNKGIDKYGDPITSSGDTALCVAESATADALLFENNEDKEKLAQLTDFYYQYTYQSYHHPGTYNPESSDTKTIPDTYYIFETPFYNGTELGKSNGKITFPSNGGISWGVEIDKGVDVVDVKDTLFSCNDACNQIQKVLLPLLAYAFRTRAKAYAIRSAGSAIMARNLSHNIGSHVLARMSNEKLLCEKIKDDFQTQSINEIRNRLDTFMVGQLSNIAPHLEQIRQFGDNPANFSQQINQHSVVRRNFSAFVQQRMDFIAQISTEMPQWAMTSDLAADVTAWFLRQQTLLEHIASSENLTTTEFNQTGKASKHIEKDGMTKVGKHIGFVMRYGEKDPATKNRIKYTPLINFTAEHLEEGIVYPKNKLLVLFPGGTIGWHAFFVILEGFIRNTAKHSFKRLTSINNGKVTFGNVFDLNVIVDVIDGDTIKTKVNGIPVERQAYTVCLYSNVHINKLYGNVTGDNKDEEVRKDLAYDDSKKRISHCEELRRYTRYKEKDRTHTVNDLSERIQKSFVTDDGKINPQNWGLSEFRIAAGWLIGKDLATVGKDWKDEKDQNPLQIKAEIDPEQFIKCDTETTIAAKIKKINDKPLIKPICNIKPEEVYDLKLNDFRTECRNNAATGPRWYYEFKMFKPQIVAVETSDSQFAEKKIEGLTVIDNPNADNRAFEYYIVDTKKPVKGGLYGKIKEEYLTNQPEIGDKRWLKLGDILSHYPGRIFVLIDGTKGKDIKTQWNNFRRDIGVLGRRLCCLHESEYTTWKDKLTRGEKSIEEFATALQMLWIVNSLYQGKTRDYLLPVLYNFLTSDSGESRSSEGFFPISTCPYDFIKNEKQSGGIKSDAPSISISEALVNKDVFTWLAGNKEKVTTEGGEIREIAFVFGHHCAAWDYMSGNPQLRREGMNEKDIFYAEAATGNCSYFGQQQRAFADYANNERLVWQFVEAAMMRVLIIDERVQEQFDNTSIEKLFSVMQQRMDVGYLDGTEKYSQHPPEKSLKKSGYIVVQYITKTKDITIQREKQDPNLFSWRKEEDKNMDYDIVIIHQGIIDKYSDKLDKQKALLDALKAKFPFVVVMSGRGMPENLKSTHTRFLPFSAIKAGPTGTMYEKFPLVQTVLSMTVPETR